MLAVLQEVQMEPVHLYPLLLFMGWQVQGSAPLKVHCMKEPVGERVELTVPAAEAQEFFGHLLLPLRQLLALQIMPHTLVLQVEVTAVHDADNREIVQSLAKAGSGCGGSCGCGC